LIASSLLLFHSLSLKRTRRHHTSRFKRTLRHHTAPEKASGEEFRRELAKLASAQEGLRLPFPLARRRALPLNVRAHPLGSTSVRGQSTPCAGNRCARRQGTPRVGAEAGNCARRQVTSQPRCKRDQRVLEQCAQAGGRHRSLQGCASWGGRRKS
jgi:hypothetical protein